MAEFIVTTLSDELNDGATIAAPGGDGLSLREAIGLANAETGEDSIVFADGLEGVVQLNNDAGTLQINDSLSIFGDNRITISGDVLGDDSDETGVTDIAATDTEKLADNTQLFLLGANALFSGLTLTGGRSADFGGGAIDAIGNELTILGSTFAGNITYGEYGGGAIYSNGQLTIRSSTFDRNIASDGSYDGGHGGGAIFSRTGNLNAINTTFVGNQALQGTHPMLHRVARSSLKTGSI